MFYSMKFVLSASCTRVARFRLGRVKFFQIFELFRNFNFILRLLELEADEDAPRHISLNNEDSKNIPLSVAEAQVAKIALF